METKTKAKIHGMKPEFSDYQLNRIIQVFEKDYSMLNAQAVSLQSQKNLSAEEAKTLSMINHNLEETANLIYIAENLRDFEFS